MIITLEIFYITMLLNYGCLAKKKPKFKFRDTDFTEIVETTPYQDNSIFIKDILENDKLKFITAPFKFGKTTNLEMVKRFLEIEVDKNDGTVLSSSDYEDQPIRDTNNYKLFTDNNLKITKHKDVMDKYFGRYPVVYIDFECDDTTVCDLEDAINYYKLLVHETYKPYRYLSTSDQLSEEEKKEIVTWSMGRRYDVYGYGIVKSGFHQLMEFLYRHFNKRKIFLLIDNFDSVVLNAMASTDDDENLEKIIKFTIEILSVIVNKENNNYEIGGGIIMGMSDIETGFILAQYKHIETYKFLDDHKYRKYFGFTEQHIKKLYSDEIYKLDENMLYNLSRLYGPYLTKNGEKVYNSWSIINYLHSKYPQNYWARVSPHERFRDTYKFRYIREKTDKLLRNKPLKIKHLYDLKIDDIITLRNMIDVEDNRPVKEDPDLYFLFLLQCGYLSYTDPKIKKQEDKVSYLRIPNKEMRNTFVEEMKEHYIQTYKLDCETINECADFFRAAASKKKSSDERSDLIDYLKNFQKYLKEILEIAKESDKCFQVNATTVESIVLSIIYETTYDFIYEFKINGRLIETPVVFKNNYAIIVEFGSRSGPMEANSMNGLMRAVSEKYYTLIHKDVFAKRGINKFVILAINIDKKMHPTVSCLKNSADLMDALHVPPIS